MASKPPAGGMPPAGKPPTGGAKPPVQVRAPEKQGPVEETMPFGYVPRDKVYKGYEVVAPADFPALEAGEHVVDESMLKDKAHNSIPLLVAALFFICAFIAFVVVLAFIARCDLKAGDVELCNQIIDVSSQPGFYTYDTFLFYVPTVYVWAAMTAGAFGLVVICLYAFSVLRQDVGTPRMVEIATYIREGAQAFLIAELIPLLVLWLGLLLLAGLGINWRLGGSYAIGAILSYVTGYVGMSMATRGNVRTAAAAANGLSQGLNVAFRAGAVMGLSVVSIGIAGLSIVYLIFRDVRALSGFSAGASTIALFARVGGGIYTKAADVGADLVGKVESDIPEDDPRNPATIADNVGDNVGDVAGMGADLFESFVGSIVAAVILAAGLPYFFDNPYAMCVFQHLIIDAECGSPTNPPFLVSIANTICAAPISPTLGLGARPLYTYYPSSGVYGSLSMFIALPFMLAMVGVIVGVICTVYVHVPKSVSGEGKGKGDVMESLLNSLRLNVFISSILVIGGAAGLCFGLFDQGTFADQVGFKEANLPAWILPETDTCAPLPGSTLPRLLPVLTNYRPWDATLAFVYPSANEISWRLFIAILIGLYLGMIIGYLTEFFTAGTYGPTQGIASSGEYGAGAVVIQGLGVGMLSTVLPLALVVAVIIGSYNLFGSYAIALSAVGMLSTLGVTMATDAYGPVADNAGGIAEMAEMPSSVRDTTDALDALGNTTAATGKGFSNGSAILTAYALLSALAQDSGLAPNPRQLVAAPGIQPQVLVSARDVVDLVDIYVVGSVFVGIMLPFLFGALTMLAVSRAAQAMIVEVRRQFRDIRGLREGMSGVRPDHVKCVKIATTAALFEMALPGLTAIMSPLIIGFGFGQRALIGLLLGAIGSGYMLGILMSNAGGAWDNAKKLVESGFFGKRHAKGSQWHKATVAGDTVGDPFKDTSGPSMNILIKLMTVFGLVSVPYMQPGIENGLGWIGAIILVITLLTAAVFSLWWYLKMRKLREEARAKPSKLGGEKPPPLKAKATHYNDGGIEMNGVFKNSALYEAWDGAGGDRAFKDGNKDPLNMPGLYNGTGDYENYEQREEP
ncbi:putative K(+)-stimulated pyrophosphate-energized sodium pump [Porphyridium purpureum]|uniref:H(+)-exporting diphosphatase n=1 Tax=Porphyridium purpureum TaxID=35688 RepID=A0A5J4ZA00_PORPP|nr:putative K(+)-stimulated pyrophosphate-energized sodium pump [Porphyridium purpureum]|eukprot:POR4452..scf295_1